MNTTNNTEVAAALANERQAISALVAAQAVPGRGKRRLANIEEAMANLRACQRKLSELQFLQTQVA